MDRQLNAAARSGDVNFLRTSPAKAASKANNDYSYFLSSDKSARSGKNGNILHLAAWEGREEFFREALENLPPLVVDQLLSQHEPSNKRGIPNSNPLHVAAAQGHLGIIRLILDFYNSPPYDSKNPPPTKVWLGQDANGSTPFHIALEQEKEECALELLSVDMESHFKSTDHDGHSALFLAVKFGCSHVALKILDSDHPYAFTSSERGRTPLHFVTKCSVKEVCKLLVKRHPEFIKSIDDSDGSTVLHSWLQAGELWPFEYLIKSDDIALAIKAELISLIDRATEKASETPLIAALHKGNVGAIRIFVDAYEQERANLCCSSQTPLAPWLKPNNDGKTPLDLAILELKEEVALCFLSPEINSVLQGQDNPLFLAIDKQCYKVAEGILDIQQNPQHGWSIGLTSGRGRNVLHGAANYKEEVATWLVKKLPLFISEKDDAGKTPLQEASEAGAAWLIEVMLKTNPSSLTEEPLAWVEACKRGDSSTVQAFINHCPNLRDVCLEHHDTPLHHIKLGGYTLYKEFLKIPIFEELKYTQDSDGATPLHRAIMNLNIGLAEALLSMNWIDWRIKDNSGQTSMDLLAAKCSQDQRWEEMCKRVGINSVLKMTYVQHETKLFDMRNILSVVAVLLATITFTAGFTPPSVFNNDTRKATMPKKAAFLVFLIADTYALCCSMLVLFCLIWSMVCDRNKSLLLIDRSMKILMQSLYGTLVAFVIGVYAVIFDKSKWAAILIIAMCSLVAVSATTKILLYTILDKITPAANKNWIRTLFLKLGNAVKGCRTRLHRSTLTAPASSNV